MTILVAGGSGFLGTALVRAWRGEGHDVRVLTRRPRASGDVAWSPDDENGAWTALVRGADAVVNLVGDGIAERRWTAARKAAIRSSRVRVTRALAMAVRRAPTPPRVFVSASGVGIYGFRTSEPLVEESPPASDYLAQVCREWEAEALTAADATRVVLLRSGVVLAAHGGALPQMARPFHFFVGGRVGTGRQYLSWIHLADWESMVRWAARTDAVAGPLNVTTPEPVTNAEFSRLLGTTLRRPSLLPAPSFALRLALGEMADALLLGGQRALPAKALRLGFEFQFPSLAPALQHIYRR